VVDVQGISIFVVFMTKRGHLLWRDLEEGEERGGTSYVEAWKRRTRKP
jgi:hypothetical protein